MGAYKIDCVGVVVSAHVYTPNPTAGAILEAAPQQLPFTAVPGVQATAETFDIMRDIVIKIIMYFLSIYFFKV